MTGWKNGWAAVALASAPLAAQAQAQVQVPTQAPASDAVKPAAPTKTPPAAKPATKTATKTVEGVTVVGAAAEVQTSIDKHSYALGKDLQATTGSIADALRNLPSVEVDLNGGLSIRGDGNVTILVDGKPSPAFEGAARADSLQNLPADQIERVEVITNPSAALSPEGTGGVINLISKKSRGAGWTGSAYVTASTAALKRAGINVGYNSKILAVTASVSGFYQRSKNHTTEERDGLDPVSGQFLKTFDPNLGRNLNRGPTARINATLTPDDKDQLTAALSYSELNLYGHPDKVYTLDGVTGAPAEIYDYSGHRRFYEGATSASAGWRHTFGDNESLNVDGVYNATNDRDRSLYTTTFTLPATQTAPLQSFREDGNVHHAELRVAYDRDLAGGHLKTGYEVRHEDNDYPYFVSEGPTVASLVPDENLSNHYLFKQAVNAIYATYQHPFGALDVQGGLRLEDARFEIDELTSPGEAAQHYQRAYPTLHLAYKLDDDAKLTASYSVRVERPRSIQLEPQVIFAGPQELQVGDPNLKPKETRSYELGYEQHAGSQSYEATFYWRQTKDDVAQLITDQGGGVFLYTTGNLGHSQQAGVDLSATGKLTSALTYSLGLSPYWNQIDGGTALSTLGRRALYSASGRGNLNWQADPSDLLQLNAQAGGARVQAQGVIAPYFTLNAGWRHIINDRLTATLTGQDLLAGNRFRRDLVTPTLVEHLRSMPVSRAVLLRLDYRFGGGAAKAKTPDFDYGGGAG